MKNKIIPVLMVFGLSMFCGIFVIGMGLGSVLIPLDGLGASIICASRELQIQKDNYAYIPGQETTLVTAYCVDRQTGKKENVTARLYKTTEQLRLAFGMIFGLVSFAFAMMFLKWAAGRLGIPFEDLFKPSARNV